MTFTNLIIILCCTIVLSYLLQIIVNYTNPNATIYVNMYSLYYIFLLTTLLFASACNSYIGSMNQHTNPEPTSESNTTSETESTSGSLPGSPPGSPPESTSDSPPESTSDSPPESNSDSPPDLSSPLSSSS